MTHKIARTLAQYLRRSPSGPAGDGQAQVLDVFHCSSHTEAGRSAQPARSDEFLVMIRYFNRGISSYNNEAQALDV